MSDPMKRLSRQDAGVANLMEYIMISGILMVLLVFTMLTVNSSIMEKPAEEMSYYAFTDIGNGISTRIVDIYVIAPDNGTIQSKFDIPDDVLGNDYSVKISNLEEDQEIKVYRDRVVSTISLAGIGASRGVTGNTTGTGLNRITYNSSGV
ncbi:MAG: hypothetical protein ABFC24_06300 [Methanoregulaceae archaeon]